MRNVSRIIQAIRERTDNSESRVDKDATSVSSRVQEGISDDLILEFINDGQEYLQSRIINEFSNVFTAEEIIDIVGGQEDYIINDNVLLGNKVISVEFSHSGSQRNYIRLSQRTLLSRATFSSTQPTFYILHDGKIRLNPIPSSSGNKKVRVVYYRALDKLDIRRGEITSTTPTTIVLEDDATLDNFALGNSEFVCIVDSLGNVQDYTLQVEDYDSGSRTITIPSTSLTGVTGNYVVIGQYATTHSNLPTSTERYLKLYAQTRVFHKDSSIDSVEESRELQRIERDILDSYAELSQDHVDIPVLDSYILS